MDTLFNQVVKITKDYIKNLKPEDFTAADSVVTSFEKRKEIKMSLMIKDLKSMAAGVEVKGLPLMIKTARKAFTDAEGTTYQEVVFMDASGEMTGHILIDEHVALWKSKTNICIMEGILQDTDERKKEGVKIVVFECFDAATPLTFDQGQDLQAEDWRKIREDEIKSKVRCWLVSASIQGRNLSREEILRWQEFVIDGEL